MNRKINWFGFAAGILTLIVLATSMFIPWWQLTIGDDLMRINASPVNTNFGLFGAQFTLPLISALNLVSILTFSVSGLVMLFYSLMPTKPYSKHLLGFSYKKPLLSMIIFVSGLLILSSVASLFEVNVPIVGSANLTLPAYFMNGANINASVSGSFQMPFWLAIVASALCIAARMYHERVVAEKISSSAS